MAMVMAVAATAATPAMARDSGQYAQVNPELHEWFDGIKSPRGVPCCSTSDGVKLEDPDWRIEEDGSYSVRLEGKWTPIPPDAVVTIPNRVGYAVVWIFNGQLLCFMPGSGA